MKHDDDDLNPTDSASSDIAVIGMACRFPGADDPDQFWRNLREGVESIRFFSDEELEAAGIPASEYKASNYVRAHGSIDGYEMFDAAFFGYPPREAEITDPQQRVFLELGWQALESAGYDPSRYQGLIGVWGGVTLSHYLLHLSPLRDRLQAIGVDTTMLSIGNDKDSLAPRVSYKLNLRGPAMSVQTACSTSLVAIHLACQSLLTGESDMAMAGAVSLTLPMNSGYHYMEGSILSPDGHCRPFDARAAGTVFGCGAGIVVLKRLEDALADGDTIHAVIRGSAVNNDGATKVGFTAPSITGQAEVISEALANAGVDADSIGFVEGHGTATNLGDPIEVAALTKAFRRSTDRTRYCALGSVKGNIGHLEVAAGLTGFIKAVLAVRNGEIPPSLNFDTPNPQIDFENSPFFVNTELMSWPDTATPRRAGVSSFGFGGTNTHVILEEPPAVVSEPGEDDRPWQLLVLSARSASALDAATRNLARHLDEHPETNLADAAYTLQVGRRVFEHRRALAARDLDDALKALADADPNRILTGVQDGKERQVCFLFPGQGAQHPGMAGQTYRSEPAFREHFDRCADLFQPLLGGQDLREFVLADLQAWLDVGPDGYQELAARLNRTDMAQAALFAVEYALAKLWQSWGIHPKAMMGNSLGEYVAACLAGVFSLEDAVRLVAARGRLMASLPEGDMLAVTQPEAELTSLLDQSGNEMSLSAVHGPDLCVVAGTKEAAERFAALLAERDVEARRLHTSHAFHSAMMDPILDAFTEEVRKISLKAPRVPFVSSVTGRWITPAEATNPAYWSRHLRRTVQLAEGFATVFAKPGVVLLEVGPAQALSGAARQSPARNAGQPVLSSFPHPKDPRGDAGTLIQALGGLWVAGVDVDWNGFHAGRRHRRVPLPTYPFERQRFFIDFDKLAASAPTTQAQPAVRAETAAPLAMAASPTVPPTQPVAATVRAPEPAAAKKADSYVAARYDNVDAGDRSFAAPRNEVEEIVADIWQTLLGVPRVGIHDNFFSLNGNSLIALQAIARIQTVFGVKLSVRSFFETPTVAQLAKIIAERQPGLDALAEKVRILEEIKTLSRQDIQEQLALAPPPPPATATPAPTPQAGSSDGEEMSFSLIFFSGQEDMFPEYKYSLVVEGAKFADQNGFTAIWTPERHFHSFGGLYPSPPVLAAALAMVTERLQLRSGSVVLPLHNPIRVAEDWSVVDNLSRGRVGISMASGFHPADFTFNPGAFENRREVMWDKLEVLRRLWRGERVKVESGTGTEMEVEIFPRPVQKELPVWITCSNTPETFEKAGAQGANVLSSLMGLTMDLLEERIEIYRASRARHGFDPKTGQVATMLHTFVGADLEQVKERVRAPFCNYLRSHTELLASLTRTLNQGSFEENAFSQEDLDELLMMEFERYFHNGSLMGTPESCMKLVRRLKEIGVDEICCLLDFGVDLPSVMESLKYLAELKRLSGQEVLAPI